MTMSIGARFARLVPFLMLLALLPAIPAQAQNAPRYFPETSHYVRGAFRSFWERNGGVRIFGLPITEEYARAADGRIMQYFERARFELSVVNGQAIVGLGALGVETTDNKAFPNTPPFRSTASRRYFPETEQSLQGSFKTFWERNGGLAVFGYPISEEIAERLGDGQYRTVQYFERARFESWNDGVRLGLLGRQLAPPQLLAGWPADTAPSGPLSEAGEPRPPAPRPTPVPPPPGDPAKLTRPLEGLAVRGDGSITPLAAPPGYSFTFRANGFDAAERVGVWLTRPNGGTEPVDDRLVQRNGASVSVVFGAADQAEGIWTITAQGVATGRQVTAPFKITRDYLAPPGTARPAARNGRVTPAEGGQRTVFQLSGTGFRASEQVEHWITSPDGVYLVVGTLQSDSRGRIGYAPGQQVQFGPQNSAGVYGYHYRGLASGNRVDLYMTYTGAP